MLQQGLSEEALIQQRIQGYKDIDPYRLQSTEKSSLLFLSSKLKIGEKTCFKNVLPLFTFFKCTPEAPENRKNITLNLIFGGLVKNLSN